MPPDDPIITPDDPAVDDPPQDPPAPAIATVPPSEAIRNSPEYRELARQNRVLARQAGAEARAAAAARTEAERARQVAEAKQQADLEAELAATLGEDGIAAFNEIAELSQSDPRAAAKRIAELVAAGRAQSVTPGVDPAAPPAPAVQGGTSVEPPAPPRGQLGADASLSQRTRTLDEEESQLADELDARFAATVERVQNPQTRNRTTWRERSDALIGFVAGSVLRARVRQRNTPS